MPIPDLLYLALIGIGLCLDHFVLWPKFLRRSPADPRRARLLLWSGWLIMLWTLVAAGVSLWLFEARDWGALRFVSPVGWRLWAAIGLVLALATFIARYAIRYTRSKQVKFGNSQLEKMLPHTLSELSRWVALSLTAGFCEEFIFRGYLIWIFQSILGLYGAAAFSLVVFAIGHAYQGVKGALTAGVLGGLLTLVVLILGSLWPAIVLHALADIGSGLLAWLVLRKVQHETEMVSRLGDSG